MASPGCIGASLSRSYWNPRKADFFPNFKADIELDHNVIRPFIAISGVLKLILTKEVHFNAGIRVQLDANVKLRFQSKTDNRTSVNWAIESIMKDAPESTDGNYVLSPVRLQLLGHEDDVEQKYVLSPGSYEYPFTMHMSGEPLPAPFRSKYGTLQYHIAAYMGSPFCYVQVTEQIVGFGGFNDLTERADSFEPTNFSSGLHKSVFSSKKFITVNLSTEKFGFHPGEIIPFTLTVQNPKKHTVQSVRVILIRNVTFSASGHEKTIILVLDTFQIEVGKQDTLLTYNEILNVPKHCIPSYNGKSIYSVNHLIQYEVVIEDNAAIAKGESEIIIGTTKPSAAMLVNRAEVRRMSSISADCEGVPPPRPRSYSICSSSSHHSHPVMMHAASAAKPHLQSNTPPLTSRTLSMHSIYDPTSPSE